MQKRSTSSDNLKRRSKQRPRQTQSIVAAEATLKLLINVLLSAAAIAALTKLLPYHRTQQQKLAEIRTTVQQTETQVDKLRADFGRNFDPQQTKAMMKKHSPWVEPNRRRVFLLESEDSN